MKRVDLGKYDNSWYNPGGNVVKRTIWYFVNALFFLSPFNPFSCIRIFLLRLFGAHIGTNIVIKPRVNIKYPWNLSIGDNVWIGEKVWIDNLARVEISNNCCLSQGCMLLTGNHDYKKATFDLIVNGIILENGCWIGAGTIVCPGVTVHSHAILTVGSIATGDMEPYSIYQGNPAIKIRERNITD